MQSRTADNVNDNDQNNVSPIWRRVLFYFRQIETVSPVVQVMIDSASLVNGIKCIKLLDLLQ